MGNIEKLTNSWQQQQAATPVVVASAS